MISDYKQIKQGNPEEYFCKVIYVGASVRAKIAPELKFAIGNFELIVLLHSRVVLAKKLRTLLRCL